eukprot:gene21514-27858_t
MINRFVDSFGSIILPKLQLSSISKSNKLRKLFKLSPLQIVDSNAIVDYDDLSSINNYNHLIEVGTRVVTDIDDTVKSSGGVKLFGIALGGVDVQYDRGVFYPGAFQFAFELAMNAFQKKQSKLTYSNSYSPPKVAVLTARAKEFKFALALKPEGKLCSAYRSIGKVNGFADWGVGQVYYGSVKEWIFQHRKGIRKFRNFERLIENDKKLNRINDYILIGDTGEKDEDAGERIALKYGPSRLKAIFLHCVTDNHDDHIGLSRKIPTDRNCNDVPIYYFKTYVGAATKAFKGKLISSDSVMKVISNAQSELRQLDPHFSHPIGDDQIDSITFKKISSSNIVDKLFTKSRWLDLQKDIKEAKAAIAYRRS